MSGIKSFGLSIDNFLDLSSSDGEVLSIADCNSKLIVEFHDLLTIRLNLALKLALIVMLTDLKILLIRLRILLLTFKGQLIITTLNSEYSLSPSLKCL